GVWDRKVRVLVALALAGLALMTSQDAYRLVFGLPLVYLANARTGQLLLQFLVPVLAGLGLAATLPALAEIALRRLRAPRSATASMVLALAALPVSALDVGGLTQQGPGSEAAFGLSQRDLWQRHQSDQCLTADFGATPPCRSAPLRAAFNVRELIDACRAGGQ